MSYFVNIKIYYMMFSMLNIRAEIKSYIGRRCTSLKKVIDALNLKGDVKTSVGNISHKMKIGTITFNEAQYIFDYLGYEIVIKEKKL